jgi:hypothetical protein
VKRVSAPQDDDLRPYLDLAREIHELVTRTAADADAGADELAAAIEAVPARERATVVRAVFDQLPSDRQWEVLAQVFDDDELRAHLAEEHEHRLATARRGESYRAAVSRARVDGRLDLRDLPVGAELVVGLFRPTDVRAAISRGHLSTVCARQLVLRTTEAPGAVRVIDDTFNPRSGLFVTADYDDRAWARERVASHATIRLGSLIDGDAAAELEPVLFPGARVDLEVDGTVREGLLHLGFVTVGGEDVFAG